MDTPDSQPELNFDVGFGSAGYTAWHEDRRAAQRRLGQELGLPLGHIVEVWLKGGIRLRGPLRLRENLLFLDTPSALHVELTVDNVVFRPQEMESCVRLD